MLDPRPYLAVLDELRPALPEGAYRFAADPGHYDFYGKRCVKDLMFQRLELVDSDRALTLRLELSPNPTKHMCGLVVTYHDVRANSVEVAEERPLGSPRLDGVRLDEVLPHPHGASHEIAFNRGTVHIVCADLTTEWQSELPQPN